MARGRQAVRTHLLLVIDIAVEDGVHALLEEHELPVESPLTDAQLEGRQVVAQLVKEGGGLGDEGRIVELESGELFIAASEQSSRESGVAGSGYSRGLLEAFEGLRRRVHTFSPASMTTLADPFEREIVPASETLSIKSIFITSTSAKGSPRRRCWPSSAM